MENKKKKKKSKFSFLPKPSIVYPIPFEVYANTGVPTSDPGYGSPTAGSADASESIKYYLNKINENMAAPKIAHPTPLKQEPIDKDFQFDAVTKDNYKKYMTGSSPKISHGLKLNENISFFLDHLNEAKKEEAKKEEKTSTFKPATEKIYAILNGTKFAKWYAKDFEMHGEEKGKTKEEILKEIEKMFKF